MHVALSSAQLAELGNTYRCVYIHTRVSIFVSLFDKYLTKIPSPHQYLQFQSNNTGVILVFSFFIFVTSFSDHRLPGSPYIIWFIYLFNQSHVCNQYPISTMSPCLHGCHVIPLGLWSPTMDPPTCLAIIFTQPESMLDLSCAGSPFLIW